MKTGIPTIYKGIRFRSRLEAKWACFFDMIGQKWQYEPFDLPGWIPDFSLKSGRGFSRTLVEVKPTFDNIEEVMGKAEKATLLSPDHHEHDLLLLGNCPIITEESWPVVGLVGRNGSSCECEGEYEDGTRKHKPQSIDSHGTLWDWINAYLWIPSIESNELVVWSDINVPLDDREDKNERMIKAGYLTSFLWSYACNETQWKPERRT